MLLHTIRGLFDLLKRNVVTNIGGMYQQRTETRDMLINQHRDLYLAIIEGRAEQAREVSTRHLLYVQEVLEEVRQEVQRVARAERRKGCNPPGLHRLGLLFLAFVAHGAMQLAIGIALAFGVALVVFLLALAQCDLAFDQVLAPVPGQADARVAFCCTAAASFSSSRALSNNLRVRTGSAITWVLAVVSGVI